MLTLNSQSSGFLLPNADSIVGHHHTELRSHFKKQSLPTLKMTRWCLKIRSTLGLCFDKLHCCQCCENCTRAVFISWEEKGYLQSPYIYMISNACLLPAQAFDPQRALGGDVCLINLAAMVLTTHSPLSPSYVISTQRHFCIHCTRPQTLRLSDGHFIIY